MTSPYADLDRPPLSGLALSRALLRDGGPWREVRVVARTGSTNTDLVAAAGAGAAEGLVLVAEAQDGGRGRLGRQWVAPPRAGLAVSVLLRPGPVPPARWGLLPLLGGVAVATALREQAGVPARLKWPNDVLVAEQKVAGLLAEAVPAGAGVVLGIGLNVTTRRDELPSADATSLALSGGTVLDRAVLLRAVLRDLGRRYAAWRAAGGAPEPLLTDYRGLCATLGREVAVTLPGGRRLTGPATGVDGAGRLLVAGTAVAAGDVVHVRAAGQSRR